MALANQQVQSATRRAALMVVVALLCASVAQAQTAATLGARIRDSVETWRTRSHRPVGVAVGVYRRDAVIFTEGFGTTRLGSNEPVTTRTVFHLASVTKPFVATAIMQPAENKKLDIDAPVTRYLPHFRMRDTRASQITVRQLMSHTAGMPDVTDYRWERPEYDDHALERYMRGLADSTLVFGPGTKGQYSNIGFDFLADVVSKVSGEPFEQYMQRHILTPRGMKHSTLLMTDVDSANLAHGHLRDSTGAVSVSPVYPYNRRHAASSTLHANVHEHAAMGCGQPAKGQAGRPPHHLVEVDRPDVGHRVRPDRRGGGAHQASWQANAVCVDWIGPRLESVQVERPGPCQP